MTTPEAHWLDRPTFVTGATGLVGAWTAQRLLDLGADVVCLVRDHVPHCEFRRLGLHERCSIVTGDVADQTLLERALGEYEIDTVIHLAAQTIVGVANRNPASTFHANIAGTWSVLEACRRSPQVRSVVLASSDKAYGDQPVQPYVESMPLQGRHPYDVSKSCGDLLGQAYATTYGTPVAITRCGNFYGGGDLNWNRIVPGTIRAVLRGKRPVIRSDGLSIRDYFYVEDGAAAYLTLAQAIVERPDLRGEAFNFSTGEKLTVLEVVGHILAAMNADLEPDVRAEATNEIREQRLDASKAREDLGWEPTFDFETGLARTIDWYRRFFASRA